MGIKKKIFIILLLLVFIALLNIAILKTNNNSINYSEEKLKRIYDYGNFLEKQDIKPNTIVAKINGQEILFREIETKRKSINYCIEEGNKKAENKNAFYEVLVDKLYIEFAKEYPNAVVYNLNIDQNLEKVKREWQEGDKEKTLGEYRKKWLDVLCIDENEIWLNEEDFLIYLQNITIEQMLEIKGMQILFKFATEKPELAKDKILEEKVKEYNRLQEEQKNMKKEEITEEYIKNEVKKKSALYLEIKDLYIKDLIINSNIEFCADKEELSTAIPEIYVEEK